jgi:AcrR family transcriptional regulator
MTNMKERILEAAHDILASEGPAALTTRRVCDAVGITMPTLYHHFANRDALVQSVYELALQRFMASKRSHKPTDDAIADLRKGCEQVLDFVAKNKNAAIAVTARALEEPSILAPSYVLLRERVRRAEREGRLHVAEREAAAMCWAVVQGLIALTIAPPDASVSLTATRKRLLDSLMGSL